MDPKTLTDEQRIDLWKKYEEIAMHFNDLILRLRTQALSGVTAIIAVSGIAINFTSGASIAEQWYIVSGTLLFLIAAWTAIAVLDLFYYYTLLLGAVDGLLDIEVGSPIFLSTKIEERFQRTVLSPGESKTGWSHWFRERKFPFIFYLIGLISLAIVCVVTFCVAIQWTGASSRSPVTSPLKTHVERAPGERLEVTIDPSKK